MRQRERVIIPDGHRICNLVDEHFRALYLVPDMRVPSIICPMEDSNGECDVYNAHGRASYEIHHAVESKYLYDLPAKAKHVYSSICYTCKDILLAYQPSAIPCNMINNRAMLIGHQFIKSHVRYCDRCMICCRRDPHHTYYKHPQSKIYKICTSCKSISVHGILCKRTYMMLRCIIPADIALHIAIVMYRAL